MKLTNKLIHLCCATLISASTFMVPGAQALQFETGDLVIDFDTELNYAAQWRVQGQDKRLLAKANNNDGNNNFEPGLVSNRAGFRVEMLASYGELSAFVRALGFYDDVYESDTDISVEGYQTYNNGTVVGGTVARGDFPDKTVDRHGTKARLLDSYLQYNFSLGERGGTLRVGRQVISWGEGTFFGSLNTLQNSFDAVAATAPGAEVKEILLPTGAVDLRFDVTGSLSAEVYYQWEYEQVQQAAVGHYFSTSDVTGPAAQRILAGGQPLFIRTKDDQPDDDGQWGAAARYFFENGIEAGLFFVKSHAKFPFTSIDFANGTYGESYADDIRTYGATMSTLIGNASILADVLYSPNMHFFKQAPLPEVVRGHLFQATVSLTDTIGKSAYYDEIVYLAEVIYTRNNLGEGELEGSDYIVTDDAWAYQVRVSFNYDSVIPGLDIDVPIVFRHEVEGDAVGVNSLTDNTREFSIGLDAQYLDSWNFGLTYAQFAGGGDANNVKDRDNVSLSIKYTF